MRSSPSFKYSDFRQAVRRHAPSELLPVVASRAANEKGEDVRAWAKGFAPWIFAAMARDSILYSDEYRSKPVNDESIRHLRNVFSLSHDEKPQAFDMATLLVGYLYEQAWYQSPVKEELTRTYLLLTETVVDSQYEQPNNLAWQELLGTTLPDALGASFVLHTGVMRNSGTFDPTWLDADWFEKIYEVVPKSAMKAVLKMLSATVAEAKVDGDSAPELPPALQRYAYNPLVKTPLIDLGTGIMYAPQPRYLLLSMTSENLYYRGIKKWEDDNFGASFGARVEAYTGLQLRHTGQHDVLPEFEWKKPRSGVMRSSDWFLVTPQVTILIECKSARMGLEAKAGGPSEEIIDRYIGGAYKQLASNAAEIKNANPAFAHIANDRPLVGLVVTAEPFYSANERSIRSRFPDPGIPVLTASLSDIELLASLSPEMLGEVLLKIVADPELYTWTVGHAARQILGENAITQNQLLDETFDRIFLPLLQ